MVLIRSCGPENRSRRRRSPSAKISSVRSRQLHPGQNNRCERMWSANRKNFEANQRLGKTLVENGKAPEAIPYLERARELRSGDYENSYELALANARAATTNGRATVRRLCSRTTTKPDFITCSAMCRKSWVIHSRPCVSTSAPPNWNPARPTCLIGDLNFCCITLRSPPWKSSPKETGSSRVPSEC